MQLDEWRSYLSMIGAGMELRAPVDSARLAAAEHELDCDLPTELRNLYLATDGVLETQFDVCSDLWPLDRSYPTLWRRRIAHGAQQ